MIHILFLLGKQSNDINMIRQIWVSLSLSGLSALTSIAVIFGDVTSPLSIEDHSYLGKSINIG